jgi:hypothetical protein
MDTDDNARRDMSQQGDDSKRNKTEVPLPVDDEAPVDEEMADVDANNSVSSEYLAPQ